MSVVQSEPVYNYLMSVLGYKDGLAQRRALLLTYDLYFSTASAVVNLRSDHPTFFSFVYTTYNKVFNPIHDNHDFHKLV